jgi:hypothetical protein
MTGALIKRGNLEKDTHIRTTSHEAEIRGQGCLCTMELRGLPANHQTYETDSEGASPANTLMLDFQNCKTVNIYSFSYPACSAGYSRPRSQGGGASVSLSGEQLDDPLRLHLNPCFSFPNNLLFLL